MNKTELINTIAESADLTKADAGKALQGFMQAVTETLAQGDKVSLIGFGTFSVTKRSARSCRNPQTGKKMDIAAKTVAKFKPGKQLADSVNS
ncbi:MAG: DNA-binding protein HU [Desulfobulbus sp.]|nr:MAG: DNA-binding protein HU [Desulfobulbus sp.]RUM41977.1 MAG: DNA-binding protein HU [Desulfobulbus sp.]